METEATPPSASTAPPEPGRPRSGFTTMDLTRGALLVVGTVGAVVGAWLPAPEWARSPDRAVPQFGAAVLVLAAAGAVLLWLRSRHVQDRRGAGRAAVVAGLAAAVLVVWASVHLVNDVREGYVDATGPVVAGGAGAALIGLILAVPQLGLTSVHTFTRQPAPRAGRGGRILAAALALLLAAGLAVAGGTASQWPVRTSGSGPAAVASVPQQVSEIAWTRSLPLYYSESFDLTRAVAGPGLVLITDGPDGPMVQALDGATGDTVWTYRRLGARILRARGSPDGRTVYIDSTMEGSWMSDYRIQAIDARTGDLLGMATGGDERYVHATTAGLLKQHGDDELRSLSPADMTEQWSWRPEPRCQLQGEPHVAASAIVVVVECGTTEEIVGLAPETGAETWSRPRGDIYPQYADAAGDLMVVQGPDHEESPRLTFRMLDAATGDPLAEIRSDHGLSVDRGTGCCAGAQEAPVSVDARSGESLGAVGDVFDEVSGDIGVESWETEEAVLPETLVVAGQSRESQDEGRQVTVAVHPFAPAAETVLLRTDTPAPEEFGLGDVRGSSPAVVAGPGAVFVLAPVTPVEEQTVGAGLTVIGLQ